MEKGAGNREEFERGMGMGGWGGGEQSYSRWGGESLSSQ